MATPGHSKAARIYFDGYRVTQTVNSGDLTLTADGVEVSPIEGDDKDFLQGKTNLASNINGFLDITDNGWDEIEFAAINDGGHNITILPVGNTAGSCGYVTRQISTGDSRAFDQANAVLLNWSGQNEDATDFGRSEAAVITSGEWTATEAGSDAGDEVGAATTDDTTIINVHCTAFTGFTDVDVQIEESSDDGGADAYAQVTGWTITAEGNCTAGTDEAVFTGIGSAQFKVSKAVEAYLRVTISDVTGAGSITLLAGHALAAGDI